MSIMTTNMIENHYCVIMIIIFDYCHAIKRFVSILCYFSFLLNPEKDVNYKNESKRSWICQ